MILIWVDFAVVETTGNIWDFYYESRWIVVPVPIGWLKDGRSVMKSGIGRHASRIHPGVATWFGSKCKKYLMNTAVAPYEPGRFFMFPTKPLNNEKPWCSAKNRPSIDLILRSIKQLIAMVDVLSNDENFAGHSFNKIGVPVLGCKGDFITKDDILPILRSSFDDRFVLYHKTEFEES